MLISEVERFSRYCMYRLPLKEAMLPPLAIPVCQAVQVPSGVYVFPARTSTVIEVFDGTVAEYVRVEKLEGYVVSIGNEVKIPEETPGDRLNIETAFPKKLRV